MRHTKMIMGTNVITSLSFLHILGTILRKEWTDVMSVSLGCTIFLYLVSVTLYIYQSRRATVIRIIEGVSHGTIFEEKYQSILAASFKGVLLAYIIFLAYNVFAGKISFFLIFWKSFLIFTILVLTAEGGIVLLLLVLMDVREISFSKRTPECKGVEKPLFALKAVALLMMLWSVPEVISSAQAAYINYRSETIWGLNKQDVRIAFGDKNPLDSKKYYPLEHQFVQDMYDEDNAALSMTLDSEMEISTKELGDYDHIVVADRNGIRIGARDKKLSMKKLNLSEINPSTRKFIGDILPLETIDGSVQPKGIEFYTLEPGQFFAALDEKRDFVSCRHPLIIFTGNASDTFNMPSFLYPALSTGNLFFLDEYKVSQALKNCRLVSADYPNLIDIINCYSEKVRIVHLFRRECFFRMCDCIMLLMILTVICIYQASEQAWMQHSKIFVLYTGGKPYIQIAAEAVFRETISPAVIVAAAGFLLYLLSGVSFWNIFFVLLIYISVYYVIFRKTCKSIVQKTIRREI